MQIAELRQFAAARGWQIANEYTDHVTGLPGLKTGAESAHGRRTQAQV
jgi:hypothetical protein